VFAGGKDYNDSDDQDHRTEGLHHNLQYFNLVSITPTLGSIITRCSASRTAQ